MTERKAGTEIMMRLPEQFVKYRKCFKKSKQKLTYKIIYFSLGKGRLHGTCAESSDLRV
jgi:hypothetical protein